MKELANKLAVIILQTIREAKQQITLELIKENKMKSLKLVLIISILKKKFYIDLI